MRKRVILTMILVVLLLAAAGCGDNAIMKSPSNNTKSPANTTAPGITSTPGETVSPGISASPENIEPTSSNARDLIEDLLPTELFSEEARKMNAKDLSDEELRSVIIQEAKLKGYAYYDLYSTARSAADSTKTTVDVDQTFRRIRQNNDMASTRFVLKGSRSADTGALERMVECNTPLLSKSSEAIHNMKLANQALNGLILLPAEEFSFRFFVGTQTKEKGYQEATIFVRDEEGEVMEEKGIGGGICQVASTLYGACLDLNLKIIERHPHSKQVRYAKEGRDAAIAGDYYDLKFRNNLNHPIVLLLSVEGKNEVVRICKLP